MKIKKKKKNNIGICKLCGKSKKLIKAHIIPEFMYSELYDNKHNMKLIEDIKSLKSYNKQTGIFDKDILCEKYDNQVIGQYENYAKKVLYGGVFYNQTLPEIIEEKNQHEVKWRLIKNINYKKIKLFLLTLIWKASVSKRDFFKEVILKNHEEIIRIMINDGNPGEPEDYPCAIFSYRFDNPDLIQIIIDPKFTKVENNIYYRFLIAGVFYLFYIEYKKLDKVVNLSMINRSNELRILKTPKKSTKQILTEYLGFPSQFNQ